MRSVFVFLILCLIKVLSRLFWRHDLGWVGDVPRDRWKGHRVVAILNHTSLYELLWAGSPPFSFVWQIARHGVIPVADITLQRPVVGALFRFVGQHVVSISRERDQTWGEVMRKINDPKSMVLILPEGRMMRPNGLDKNGKPMTVRGGIADILESISEGRMLLCYSGGLHHVQAPGERWPRLFRRIRMRFEAVDIPTYREAIAREAGDGVSFKRGVVADLERRRDLYCWPDPSQRPRPTSSDPTSS